MDNGKRKVVMAQMKPRERHEWTAKTPHRRRFKWDKRLLRRSVPLAAVFLCIGAAAVTTALFGGDVQADHLHRADGAGAGHGGAVGDLGRDLLVGSPLAVHILLVLGQILQNLGAGRSGISGTDLDTGFVDATGGGLVTGHQMFHSNFHLSCLFSSLFPIYLLA